MSSSLIIYFTPHTNMSASAIIALAELAIKNELAVSDTPSFIGLEDYTALLLAAHAATEDDFEQLIDMLQRWCDRFHPSGALELSIRVEALDLHIEQAMPVEGHKAISALLVEIIEAFRLFRSSSFVRQATRILVTPICSHGEARAYIRDKFAYGSSRNWGN